MSLSDVLIRLRKENYVIPYREVWYDTFLRLSLYTQGVKPNFCIERDDIFWRWPSRRHDPIAVPYDRIYDTEIFSRYPHDNVNQLMFRKSIAAVDDMKSVCDKFFEQSKSIIFQGNNFNVSTDDNKLQEWIDNVKIDGFKFYEWVKNVLYTRMFVDPNAWLCVIENHRQQLLPSEFAMPMPYIVSSAEVYYADHQYFITERYATDYTVQIFHENFKEETFNEYPHGLNLLPVMQLGGKYIRPFIWQSFIQPFVGIANTYIQEKSDSVIAKKTLAPRLQIVESECPTCNGNGKRETKEGQVPCVPCGGTGKRMVMNLGDVVAIPEPKMIMGDDSKNLRDLDRFQYKTPDPSYIDLLTKDADKEFTRAEKSLFIYRKETGGVESGESFDKQFEEKKIFFQGISDRLFHIMTETLKWVSMYLNYNNGNPEPSEFTIDKPITFDLASAEDLMLQYESEKENGLPTIITNNSQLNYLKKVEGENSVILKKVRFLQLYDPLYGNTTPVYAGFDPLSVVTHNYLSQLLELHIIKIGEANFLNQTYEDIYTALLPELQQKVPDTQNFIE